MSKNIQTQNKPPVPPTLGISVQQHNNSIPSAVELNNYKLIDPSFPERIMKMAENHNRTNTIERTRLLHKGMNMSFISLFIMTTAGIYFGIIGNNTLAGLCLSPLILTTILSTIKKKALLL